MFNFSQLLTRQSLFLLSYPAMANLLLISSRTLL
jgi:hypothetical protein